MKIATCFGIRRESASYTRQTATGVGAAQGAAAGGGTGGGAATGVPAHMNVSHWDFYGT